jgi:dienelactone hydrolase
MSDALVDERRVAIGPDRREGILRVPTSPLGLVVFAHGAGSSRLSPRNGFVADRLAERGFGSLLFDLLTEAEAADRVNVFDIPLLGARLVEAIRWARAERDFGRLPVGLFGASTAAAAALVAAADEDVAAVVSRGGRPDLAGAVLARVSAPTLLVVGGADRSVAALNREAAQALRCDHRIVTVPGATHLFEEPGALERVVELAADWFELHFRRAGAP